MANSSEALKEYRARCAHILLTLDETESDLGSILVNVQQIMKEARLGFNSERCNVKIEGGISTFNEQRPEILVSCVNIQLKIIEILTKAVEKGEVPDNNIVVNIQSVNLEDTL